MKLVLTFLIAFQFGMVALAAAPKESADKDSITVTVMGTLKTGVVAIGAETTGTTITTQGITWELDFGKNAKLQKEAEAFNGKKVRVKGRLHRRPGVEVKERWIVTVRNLQASGKAGEKAE